MWTPKSSVSLVLGLGVVYAAAQEYDYVVVGSGPGGGPLAVDLAKAGNSVLLLDSGVEINPNSNRDIWFPWPSVNDGAGRWDFFVKNSDDPERELKNKHMTWRTADGGFYVGLDPPEDAEQLGVWYPRFAALGGGAFFDDAVLELPPDSTWDTIADATGDDSWSAAEMRKVFEEIEKSHYVKAGTEGHGFDGWLETNRGYGSWIGPDVGGTTVFRALSEQAGGKANMTTDELRNQLTRDINGIDEDRDQATGIFGLVTHTDVGAVRWSPANYISNALKDNPDLPLTVELESTLTEIVWDPLSLDGTPTVSGVNYVVGPNAYKAHPRYNAGSNTTTASAYVGKELIIAGGVFNSPQILKVNGIGPADELEKHNITVVSDVPGVGANLGDNYEATVLSLANTTATYDLGSYTIQLKTSVSDGDRDITIWPARLGFDGYFPGYPADHGQNAFSLAFAVKNPHSSNGTVTLRSADPLEPPEINFRFFAEGEEQDLQAMYEAVEFIEKAKARITQSGFLPIKEISPCPTGGDDDDCTEEDIKESLKTQTWSRHGTGTCAMGDTDKDPMAVVDGNFRVKGVDRLRVVDASVFPKQPGSYPVLPTFMVSKKAVKAILGEN
ncbi:hypothetical protein GGS20DRAFT_42641 [Poronia punctata]|nr:hypothetical protein GGS20DRAFT_42641 [Poronia punctata]